VLMNVSSYIQQIVIGVIIVLAVAFDTFAKSRRRRIQGRARSVSGHGLVVFKALRWGFCPRQFWRMSSAATSAVSRGTISAISSTDSDQSDPNVLPSP
jgi:hypothetical protein